MLPNHKITGSLPLQVFNEFEFIVKDEATQDCLQSIRCEEPTGTCLEPEAEMHVGVSDRNEIGGRCGLFSLHLTSTVQHSVEFSELRGQDKAIPRVMAPAKAVEGDWVFDEDSVFANRTGSETDMCFYWKNEAVMERDGFFDDTVEVH